MSRRSFRKAALPFEEPAVNLTPLIDVVFVILIMFIVVAPLLELDQVELANAAANSTESPIAVQENSPIAIHVRGDNTILFNNRSVTAAELTEQLRLAKQKYPNVRPQLFHDRRGQFGTYQTVKNAAEIAGFKQMDLILQPAG
jgi:biopolymer transport protein ExbD